MESGTEERRSKKEEEEVGGKVSEGANERSRREVEQRTNPVAALVADATAAEAEAAFEAPAEEIEATAPVW